MGRRKFTYEEVYNFFKDRGCELLTIEYQNVHQKLQYKCSCGEIRTTTFNSFRRQKNNCKKCFSAKQAKTYRHSIEYVRSYFEQHGCILLEDQYINARQKLNYICQCGKRSVITFNKFEQGRRCKECGTKKRIEQRKHDYIYVYNYFKENGCELLEKVYINASTPMKYICSCGTESVISFDSFRRGSRCNNCKIKFLRESRKGNNNPHWNGGTTELLEALRNVIEPWRIDSFKAANYTCVITGQRGGDLVIHHLYPFHKIAQESLYLCKLEVKETIGEYSEDEWNLLGKTCLDLHYKYGLGACITKEMHTLFHSKYGKKDFTPEDFVKFKDEINNAMGV